MNSGRRQLLAILSGDVAGYSRLMALDEEATIKTLAIRRNTVGNLVVGNHGRLVDFTGDNFLAEFDSAINALRSAIEIQHSIQAEHADTPEERRMSFRIGAHVGDVRIDGDRIYGDAVNIAARLEGLSEIGGICLSRQILDQVSGQVGLDYEDLGDKILKNIQNPVHAFSIPAKTLVAELAFLRNENRTGILGIGVAQGIPSIAVLPFTNLSIDPELEYLVEAMTVEIITGLSCDRRLSVIAYNSVRQFKGNTSDLGEFARILGVRYIVEGRVRHLGSRLRVTTALIEVETKREIWGGKFDRASSEIFEVFDELIEAIVTALASHLKMTESERFRRKRPEQLDAWALATRAMASRGWISLEENLLLARRALEIDPKYAYAWAVLGFLTAFKYPMGLSEDHQADIDQALRQTDKALTLDSGDPWNLVAKAVALQYGGRPTESLGYLQRSLRLNPSDVLAHCYYGRALMYSGKPALAIAHFERFKRLNPNDPGASTAGMYHAIALAFLQRWEEAEEAARESLAACGGRNPWSWVFLVIALRAQDKTENAEAAVNELKKVAPHWDRSFVENFLMECQEDKALLVPVFEILRSVWLESDITKS